LALRKHNYTNGTENTLCRHPNDTFKISFEVLNRECLVDTRKLSFEDVKHQRKIKHLGLD